MFLCYVQGMQIKRGSPRRLATGELNVHSVHTQADGRRAERAQTHSHSIAPAFRSPTGSHALPHYLLSPPVTAVCFYGDRPLKGGRSTAPGRWLHQMTGRMERESKVEKRMCEQPGERRSGVLVHGAHAAASRQASTGEAVGAT